MKHIRIIFPTIVLSSLLFSLSHITPVFATSVTTESIQIAKLSQDYLNIFSKNNILFYDPFNCRNTSGSGCGEDITGTSWQDRLREVVEKYGIFLMNAQIEYGVPWEIPIIHGHMESHFGTANPSVAHGTEECGYYNWQGYKYGANSLFGISEAEMGNCKVYHSDGGFGSQYKNLADMYMSFYVDYLRNGAYDAAFEYASPTNFNPREFLRKETDGIYCVAGCSAGYLSVYDSDIDTIHKIAAEHGWPTSEELMKQYNIPKGGNWSDTWGDIKKHIDAESHSLSVDCSSMTTLGDTSGINYRDGKDSSNAPTAVGSSGKSCGEAGANPIVTIDGHDYMFPLAGAAKDNYLEPNNVNGASQLSPLPCSSYSPGACHHDYVALDMGLYKDKVDGDMKTPSDYPDLKGYSDMYYYSTGVKALAFVDGEITSYGCYKNSVPNGYDSACKCASITYKGADGLTYWIGHLSYDPNIKAGDKFKLGDIIGEVGPPPCAQGTQAHIHINISPSKSNNTKIYDIMNATYEALPETSGGSSSAGCANVCKTKSNSGSLASLTEGQINTLAEYFNGKKGDIKGVIKNLNCPELVKWFLYHFTDLGYGDPSSFSLGNGGDVAHTLAEAKKLEEGNEAQPFAVFSTTADGIAFARDNHTGQKYGHTGLVVAVDGDDLLTLETGSGDAKLHHRSAKQLCQNSKHSTCYTYLGGHVDESKLSGFIGGL